MIELAAYQAWISTARPGEKILYHTGEHLMGLHGKRATADAVLRDSEAGLVFPYQRRIDGFIWGYHVMKLKPETGRVLRSWSTETA